MEFVFAILSLFFTVIFGLPALFAFIKEKKTRLYFIQEKMISFQNDLLENFSDLTILYRGNPVSDKLVFLKGEIRCTGSKDIDKPGILNVICTNGDWLNFNITNSTEGMILENVFSGNTSKINFDLIKSNEMIEFDGIIQLSDSAKSSPQIQISHRIPNVDSKVAKFEKTEFLKLKTYLTNGIITFILLIGILFLLNGYSFWDLKPMDPESMEELPTEQEEAFRSSNEYLLIMDYVRKNNNGIKLLFKPTKVYEVTYTKQLSEIKETRNLFFKRKISYYMYIMYLVIFVGAITAISSIYNYFYLLLYKKRLKIEK